MIIFFSCAMLKDPCDLLLNVEDCLGAVHTSSNIPFMWMLDVLVKSFQVCFVLISGAPGCICPIIDIW